MVQAGIACQDRGGLYEDFMGTSFAPFEFRSRPGGLSVPIPIQLPHLDTVCRYQIINEFGSHDSLSARDRPPAWRIGQAEGRNTLQDRKFSNWPIRQRQTPRSAHLGVHPMVGRRRTPPGSSTGTWQHRRGPLPSVLWTQTPHAVPEGHV